MDISSTISPKIKIDEFECSPNYEVDHFLTRDFRNAQPLIKEFNYDFSQLDKKDFTNFIQLVVFKIRARSNSKRPLYM